MMLKERLVQLREENGIAQIELAERLHVTRQAVSRWEGGKTEPDVDTLIAIAKIFGVSLDYLCGADEVLRPEKKEEPEEQKQASGPKKKGAAIALAALALLLLLALAACFFGNRPVQKTESTELTFDQLDVDHVQNDSIDRFDLEW